ncbi:hypothetical protein CYMTET_33368 [Cymbomonas tetramitiformis]|uniref:Uncharacterized protein n=1 Tax=Cymbomonas tetramitiformis TaxID=36881 RepID=A0AAE0FDB9_9CHLO|nr:hypothetical protein CYMTET_33368 [Cymbomonas tetramitiformis]
MTLMLPVFQVFTAFLPSKREFRGRAVPSGKTSNTVFTLAVCSCLYSAILPTAVSGARLYPIHTFGSHGPWGNNYDYAYYKAWDSNTGTSYDASSGEAYTDANFYTCLRYYTPCCSHGNVAEILIYGTEIEAVPPSPPPSPLLSSPPLPLPLPLPPLHPSPSPALPPPPPPQPLILLPCPIHTAPTEPTRASRRKAMLWS